MIGRLQEMAQKRCVAPPSYDFAATEVSSSLGFSFLCTVTAFGASAQGGGKNKKDAKHEAAKELLSLLTDNVPLETVGASVNTGSAGQLTDKDASDPSCLLGPSPPVASTVDASEVNDRTSLVNSDLSFKSLSSIRDSKFISSPSNAAVNDEGVRYVNDGVNYIGKLQEESVRRGIGVPRYSEESLPVGNDFVCVVYLSDISAKGLGNRKKDAKNAAARALYSKLINPVTKSSPSKSPTRDLQPAELSFSSEKDRDAANDYSSPPNTECDKEDNANYVGKLKEYLDKRGVSQTEYEDDGKRASACATIDGMKLVGYGGGFASKKQRKQAAAKDLLQQLCPVSAIPCSPIGMCVGSSDVPTVSNAGIDEDALTSASHASPSPSSGNLASSTVELDEAEDILDKLIEDLNLPMPEFKISKMKTKGSNDRMLHMCVISIAGERDKIGSGESRIEATQKAACNMVMHLRYKHKSAIQNTVSTGDSAIGSTLSTSLSTTLSTLSTSQSNPKAPIIATSSVEKKISPERRLGGSEPRLNLMHLVVPPTRPLNVADKTTLMTLAPKPEHEGSQRCRHLSDPGVKRVYFNKDESGMNDAYVVFAEALGADTDDLRRFFDPTDGSASATLHRRQVLEKAGVKVSIEPVERERATNIKELVKGTNDANAALCFLKLNFDPNYEEVAEFQWNRKRRLDKQLLFDGKGANVSEAEADAFLKAAKHLKVLLKGH